ncbi:MAG: hypothetical protein KKB59_19325, partial [Spirochaetes bacterium]|nr:hypothetical protein [Spirochaetota bacterium]
MSKKEKSIFTIGADPEFFLMSDKSKKFISAIPLISGTKAKPINAGNGVGIIHDNVLLEINIPPAKTEQEFVDSMKISLTKAQKLVGKSISMH